MSHSPSTSPLEFWRSRLEGEPVFFVLPGTQPRPAVWTSRGGACAFEIGSQLYVGLRNLAEARETGVDRLLLAGFALLLHRYSHQETIRLGNLPPRRAVDQPESLAILTCKFSKGMTLEDLLAGIAHEVREATLYGYGPCSLSTLADRQAFKPDPSYPALCNVAFTFTSESASDEEAEQAVPGSSRKPANDGSIAVPGSASAQDSAMAFDLEMRLVESDGSVAGQLRYYSGVFLAETIRRMATHFVQLLQAIVEDPAGRIGELPMMAPDERQQVLNKWNQTRLDYQRDQCLHELIEEQAARTPGAIAAVFQGRELCYRELNEQSNQLAHHLVKLGAGPEVLIGICMERSLEAVVSLLAVLKAGGAYVPLDPAYPVERCAFMAQDAKIHFLLTEENLMDRFSGIPAAKICLQSQAGGISAEPIHNLPRRAAPANLAYVLYTSGSTGKPKGVGMQHRNAVAFLNWAVTAFSREELAGVLACTSFSFDLSIFELFATWTAGGRVMLVQNALEVATKELSGLTLINTVPSAMNELVRMAALPSSVQTVNLAGEPLRRGLVQSVYECGVQRVLNLYGPTEATTYAMWCEVQRDATGSPGIGKPLANMQVFVLDQHFEPVPAGISGELFIGGDGLARGYINRPGLTAEKFVPDPFSATPGARLYRTGDFGLWRHDGTLEFLGRADQQVKVRGFRIELEEIESALLQQPEVREAAVLVHEDATGQKSIVAYLVAAEGRQLKAAALRSGLQDSLPEYMVPSEFITLEAMPRTPSGKLDRRRLPSPGSVRPQMDTAYLGPRSATEERMARLWAEVFKLDRVGVNDGFLELGGHSLLAMQLGARIRSTFGVEIHFGRMLENPSVASLAQEIERGGQSATDFAQAEILPGAEAGVLPLSYAQQRLWFLDRFQPGSFAYNIPIQIKLKGALDAEVLQLVLTEIVRRHAVLRTTYMEDKEITRQVVESPEPIKLEQRDLSGSEDQQSELDRQIEQESRRSFDLTRGPVLRSVLFRMRAEENVLLITVHHIAADGWSIDVLVREMHALYEAFLEGRPSPLPELPVQYGDYVSWCRGETQSRAVETQLEYWKRQLSPLPPPLELPGPATDRPAAKSDIGSQHAFTIARELLARLQGLARECRATLHMTLLAAFQLLLCRYTGQEDIMVASPVAGRNQKQTESLIGFFVNTLLFRTQLPGALTVAELLGRVRDAALEAYANQDVPFERLVEVLQPERDLSGTPLVQAMFSLEKDELRQWTMAGIDCAARELWNGSAKFDLTLIVEESATELACVFEYRKCLVDADAAQRMAGHLETLLSQMAEHPARTIAELEVLTPEERQELIAWNQISTAFARENCVHELFEEQARLAPDAVAAIFREQQLTYAELNHKANQLAYFLMQRGAGPDAMIGLCVEPSLETAIGLLAILKTGAAYVPLDPNYPEERLAFMRQEAGIRVLLTQQTILGRLPSLASIEAVCIDAAAWQENIASLPGGNLKSSARAENLAYGMFTSGSSGKPKCVGITHRGVIRLVRSTNYLQLNAGDRVAQVSNLSFDALTFEVWGALLNGAALVGIERDIALDPRQLAQAIRRHGITAMLATTALFNQIAYEAPETFSSLRGLVFGGEAADANAVRRVLAAGAPPRLVNAYGPTENTTITSWYLANDLPENAATVPIGTPVSNTTVYVLDPSFQPAPLGAIGELCTGGDGLARGYVGRPGLTAEKFMPNPFGGPGDRLYRTGDLVRRQANGLLEFVARNDQQVKYRGFRIELAEIEANLRECAGVRDAIVTLREDSPGDKRLVAYVTAGDKLQGRELRIDLAARLPEYMVPSDFVCLEKFPLTSNGKVDRKALPVPQRSRELETRMAPRTTIEQMLVNIWAEVLHRDVVGIHDNFFEVGGHSLLAMKVIARIRETLGVEIAVRQMFEQRTVASLAKGIDQELKRSGPASAPPLLPAERNQDLPLSFAQQRIWLICQLESNPSLYNIPVVLRLTGALRVEALTRAVNEIVRRHESLRTSFRVQRGKPLQVIHRHKDVETSLVDLTGIAPEERETQVGRRIREQVRTSFDLACAPLLRSELLRLGPEENVLVLVLHHIVADGWSLGVFSKELAALYEAFGAGEESPLPALPVQYADYAIWQRRWLESGVGERQVTYWKEKLALAPEPLALPIARPRPPAPNHNGAEFNFDFSTELLRSLHALSREEGVTLFMTALAAFQVLLYRYTRQTDLALGTPIAGRTMRETEDLIGFFVNTLVLRSDLSGNPTFAALLKQVREVTLAAYANQDIPFERLVEALLPERDMSHTPLFQIMFALQNAPASEWDLAGLTLKQQRVELGSEKFDLTIFLAEDDEGLHATFAYSTELFDESAIVRMAEHYRMLLEGIAAARDRRINELPLLAESERNQILLEQAKTIVPYERDQCVQELFETQVKRTPHAAAVVFRGEKLTYRQLNHKANQVAHHLKRLGVGREVPVGLFMKRSLEMIIGMLGIVKAGGVYVPLDPEYPLERLKNMARDSGLSVLLTQRKLRNALAGFDGPVVCLDQDWPAISGERHSNPKHLTTPENLIYVMYTSGSTGRPKGTAATHRAVVRLVRNTNYAQFGSDQVLLQFAPISFDASTFEIWGSLLHGARLEIMPPETPSFESLGETIVQSGVTTLWITTGLFHQMVDHQLKALQSVRQVLTGGEVISVPHVRRLLKDNRFTQLINFYGPTENTTFTSFYPVPQSFAMGAVPIGTSIANTQMYVLDQEMQLLPAGVTGELYTGGDGLARCYLNRPDLTAERFVPNPYGASAGERLYRTGDLARWREDGELEFVGRVDDEVKIRGFRTDPREIEAVLCEQEGVESAAVIVQADSSGTKRLFAYVVPKEGCRVERAELRSGLKRLLPEYMVPGLFVLVNSLPLTPNGKVDRKALPKPGKDELVTEEFTSPRTPVEELLAAIWTEVLETERMGVHDNFFESGGHSLLAMQIVSRMREIFPVNLPLRTLFECPTIAELAEHLVSSELKPGLTLKIAEAFINAQKGAGDEPKVLSRSTA